MKHGIFLSITIFTTWILFPCNAQEPTHWRGPEANGIYPDMDLLNEWPAGGPVIKWTFEGLGQGHSSAVVTGDFIYTTGMIDGTGYLFKIDKNGNTVYKAAYGPEFTESWYGTRGSPVITGNRIYLVSAYGKLHCLNESNGKILWTVDMVNTYGGKTITWGYNETPVVDGDVIYCTPGGRNNSVMALNRQDGSVIWSCPGEKEYSAYCTPLLFNHNGRKILATHTESHLLGIDAKTGELLWSHYQPNQYSVHANTPIYHDGEIFYFSGYGQGSGKLTLSKEGSSISLAWKNVSMDSRMGGAVLVDGYIYGSGDFTREWKCIDWKTGENAWTSAAIAKGNVIFADGKLYCYTERGELAMAEASPEEFRILAQTRVTAGTEQHWAHSTIDDGILYVRHGNALVAYIIK